MQVKEKIVYSSPTWCTCWAQSCRGGWPWCRCPRWWGTRAGWARRDSWGWARRAGPLAVRPPPAWAGRWGTRRGRGCPCPTPCASPDLWRSRRTGPHMLHTPSLLCFDSADGFDSGSNCFVGAPLVLAAHLHCGKSETKCKNKENESQLYFPEFQRVHFQVVELSCGGTNAAVYRRELNFFLKNVRPNQT